MSNIVYNEPFECEEWIWKIHDDAYLLKKYRQIDCECSDEDEELFEYYYDFIMISCFDEKGTHLFTARKYWDEDEIHLLSRPNGSLNGNDIEMMQKLKKKFHVANIRY
ncbi:hypothetical protein [Bacillus glycinifermentans]|uniref:hypothetical protein n=1 Tax=Bacillus glycinifermentans TaxID=1664069 RepID=UPI001FF0EAE5|nr:hypothetical protein [Bacillus glycinifermentans]UOY87726.1 hypothetical protein MW696_16880 [Bacillus glycinifermentans]